VNSAVVVLALLWLGLTAYALFGGADFGGGIWDLLAGTTSGGRPTRDLIEHSLAPVWEANHVWLIFVLVVMWTGFPPAFAAVASTLYIPLTLAAMGMIARGSAFAFRKTVPPGFLQMIFGAGFALSSLLTPFFLGTVAGAVASGRVPRGIAQGDVVRSWLSPTALLGGVLCVGTCAYLAAVFLCSDAVRSGDARLARGFRTRALVAAAVVGAVAAAGIVVVHADAPALWHGLTGRGAPLVALSVLAGIAGLVLLFRERYRAARTAAGLAVAAVIWGWGVAQYPLMLPPDVTVDNAAAGSATLNAMVVTLLAGSLLLVPALVLLYRLFQTEPDRAPGLPARSRPE
jgi:cytochrome bd ubiquinol oxidase subunit II